MRTNLSPFSLQSLVGCELASQRGASALVKADRRAVREYPYGALSTIGVCSHPGICLRTHVRGKRSRLPMAINYFLNPCSQL
jgi:hypothetical protein